MSGPWPGCATARADGRLTLEEFADRVGEAYGARTPASWSGWSSTCRHRGPRPATAASTRGGSSASSAAPASRVGGGRPGPRPPWLFSAAASSISATREVDGDEVEIRAVAVLGGIEVLVPEGVAAELTGLSIAREPGLPGAGARRASRSTGRPGTGHQRVRGAQPAIRDELRQQQVGGTLKQLAGQVPDRTLARRLLADPGEVAMRAAVGLVADVLLGLEVAQDREHRGVRQRIAELVLHFATVEAPCSHSTAMISASRLLSDTLMVCPPLRRVLPCRSARPGSVRATARARCPIRRRRTAPRYLQERIRAARRRKSATDLARSFARRGDPLRVPPHEDAIFELVPSDVAIQHVGGNDDPGMSLGQGDARIQNVPADVVDADRGGCIGQCDDRNSRVRIEGHERPIAVGAAAAPHRLHVVGGRDSPAEPHLSVWTIARPPRLEHGPSGGNERLRAAAEEQLDEFEHVVDRRIQPTRRIQCAMVSFGTGCSLPSYGDASRDRRALLGTNIVSCMPSGSGDALGEQRRIALPRTASERIPQQAKAPVRIFERRTRIAREIERCETLVELLDRVAGVFVEAGLRCEVGRPQRQTGGMRCEIEERDLLAAVLGSFMPPASKCSLVHRLHLAPLHHVGEQQRREDFSQRRDLEDRGAVHLAAVLHAQGAVGDDPSSLRRADADDDAGAPFAQVDALDQQRVQRRLIDGLRYTVVAAANGARLRTAEGRDAGTACLQLLIE